MLFPLFAGVALGFWTRSCDDIRFCRDNLDRHTESLTLWSISSFTVVDNVFQAPLQANGVLSSSTLLISKIAGSGLRFRVDPGENLSRYRFDIRHDDLIVNSAVLAKLDPLTAADQTSTIAIDTTDTLRVEITKSPLSIGFYRNAVEYLRVNNDNFLFIEDGSFVPEEVWHDEGVDFPAHGKTAIGASFRFQFAETELSGLAESNNPADLPDTDSERRYALDSYSHYGYVPFVVAHNSKYEFTPALFWMNPTDMFYRLETGSGERVLSIISEGGFIDFIVFIAPVSEVHPQYFRVTGFPAFPPGFALGYHQCRYGYPSQAHVEEVMANLSAINFPQDVQWLDIDHLEHEQPFILSSTWWTNPTKFFNDAAAAGRVVVRITDPHMFKNETDIASYLPFKEANDKGYFVTYNDSVFIASCWPGPSGWPDFLRGDVRKWWGTLYARFGFPENVHVWNDMNEAATWGSIEDTLPKDGYQLQGAVEVREVHSLYGFSNTAATHAGLLAMYPNRRPFILTRSFFAGSQKFTWHWSGDNWAQWKHLPLGLDTLLASNIAGVPFTGSDLGGFAGETSAQLLARWYQLGAYLFPLCREHSATDVSQREPYLYKVTDPAQYETMITAIVDRYRLLPLIYTAARDTSEFGQPFVAPLWYYFPRDSIPNAVWNAQPILGGKLMVVPQLFEDVETVTVYKPPGTWYDLRTGKALVDDQVVPTGWSDHVPSFLRGGSITALFSDHGMTVKTTFEKNLTLYIAFDEKGEASGSLYFDDLATLDHLRGQFLRVLLNSTATSLTIRRLGDYCCAPIVERIVIYGASGIPEFGISGTNATYADGVVDIRGLALSLSEAKDFPWSEAGGSTKGLSTGVIVVIVVFGVIAVIAVVFLAFFLWRRSGPKRTGHSAVPADEQTA